MIKPGDILMVDTNTPLGLAIKKVLSTDERKCAHSHDAVIFEDDGKLMVYNARIPFSKNSELYTYLAYLRQHGQRWCIARPDFLHDFDNSDSGMAKLFRKYLSHDCKMMEGNAYSTSDLFVIFKRRYNLHKIFPLINRNKKAQFYCTEAVKRLFLENMAYSWLPPELECEFPAPIHTEHMCENGRLKLVQESEEGFFNQLCGKAVIKK